MSGGAWSVGLAVSTVALTYAGLRIRPARATIIAWTGAAAAIVVGTATGAFDLRGAVGSIDFNTLSLLFGTMIFAVLLRETGFFQSLAVRAAKRAGGRPWCLMLLLGGVTAGVSLVLDNTTTVLVMVPVAISLIDLLELPITPFLVGQVVLANIGGAATLIGNAPNMLVGSAGGLGFLDFIVLVAPIAVAVWAAAQGILLVLFRPALRGRRIVVDRLAGLDERRAIVAPRRLKHLLATLAVTVGFLFVHEAIGLSAGTVALAGAAVGLLWVHSEFDRILTRIRWDVLLRMAALFIVVGCLRASGALAGPVDAIAGLLAGREELAVVAVLWTSAVTSALLGDVPYTIAALPIVAGLDAYGVSSPAIWWALALGVGFGANLTLFGSAANRSAGEMAAALGVPLTARRWSATGMLVGLGSCSLGTLALLFAIRIGLL